jgi:hypothetical protein
VIAVASLDVNRLQKMPLVNFYLLILNLKVNIRVEKSLKK